MELFEPALGIPHFFHVDSTLSCNAINTTVKHINESKREYILSQRDDLESMGAITCT